MNVTFMIQPVIEGGVEEACEAVYDAWFASFSQQLKLKRWDGSKHTAREIDTIDDSGNVEWADGTLTSRVWVHVDHTRALEVCEALRLLWANVRRDYALSLFNVFFIVYDVHANVGHISKLEVIAHSLAADVNRNDDGSEYDNVECVCYKEHQLQACVAAFLGIVS